MKVLGKLLDVLAKIFAVLFILGIIVYYVVQHCVGTGAIQIPEEATEVYLATINIFGQIINLAGIVLAGAITASLGMKAHWCLGIIVLALVIAAIVLNFVPIADITGFLPGNPATTASETASVVNRNVGALSVMLA